MGPRRRGPGLMRMAARTAVVAGTATAVSGNVQRRQQRRYADKDAEQQAEYDAYAASQAPVAPVQDIDSQYAEIEKLGSLLEKGLITQAEFDAKKRSILGL